MKKEDVFQYLKSVKDPDLDKDIVALGMVTNVEVQDKQVCVHLESSTHVPGFLKNIEEQIREKLNAEEKGLDIQVQVSKVKPQSSLFSQPQRKTGVKQIIAVGSGKGGVGKTTISVNLALALKMLGKKVGIMDGDIYGPNIPLMLGVAPETRPTVSESECLIPVEAHGLKMISMGVLIPPDQPMIWRGPMLHSAVNQFLQQVDWGELDYLIVDLPPGTGDVQLSLVQSASLAGAVLVTTPQEVALMDVRKAIAMLQQTQVPLLGVIENMTGDIFGKGGGKMVAERYQIPFLGEIPLTGAIRQGGDQGKPIILSDPDAVAAKAFIEAAQGLMSQLPATEVAK